MINLKLLRQKTGLTQGALATAVGVSKDTITSLETGRLKLSECLGDRIALITGYDPLTAEPIDKALHIEQRLEEKRHQWEDLAKGTILYGIKGNTMFPSPIS